MTAAKHGNGAGFPVNRPYPQRRFDPSKFPPVDVRTDPFAGATGRRLRELHLFLDGLDVVAGAERACREAGS